MALKDILIIKGLPEWKRPTIQTKPIGISGKGWQESKSGGRGAGNGGAPIGVKR